MRRAVVDFDDEMRAAWSGPLLLLDVAEVPREDDDPILAPTDDGAKKASVVLGRVASWRAAAVRNEAVLRLRRGAGTTIVVLVLSLTSLSIYGGSAALEPELFRPSTEFLRSTDGEEAKRLDKK